VVEVVPEHGQLLAGGEHDTMVGVHLSAPPAAEGDTARAPVDVVVVSDVSGSMRGDKLSLLKETTNLLLKELSKQDRVGLVTFDTDVDQPLRLSANVHMDGAGKSVAESKVDQFRAGSATNLSGGLFAGVEQFTADAAVSTRVKTLLLLTDGIANHGVRDKAQLVRILSEMLRARPDLSVHCFGYGSNHQSDLLRGISEAGSGSYYFLQNNDDIRSAFGDCLGGVLSVVAQNLVLEVQAQGDARIRKVHHPSVECLEEGRRYAIRFNDLYGEEERDVLVSMHVPPATSAAAVGVGTMDEEEVPNKQPILECTLKYVNVVGGNFAQANATAEVDRPLQMAAPATPDPRIMLHRTRVQVADTLDGARGKAERGDLRGARDMLSEMCVQVKSLELATLLMADAGAAAEDMLTGFADDLEECQKDLADTQSYQQAGRHKMSSYAAGHAMQRCMESATTDGSTKQRHNAYRTAAKKAKASAFMSMFK